MNSIHITLFATSAISKKKQKEKMEKKEKNTINIHPVILLQSHEND